MWPGVTACSNFHGGWTFAAGTLMLLLSKRAHKCSIESDVRLRFSFGLHRSSWHTIIALSLTTYICLREVNHTWSWSTSVQTFVTASKAVVNSVLLQSRRLTEGVIAALDGYSECPISTAGYGISLGPEMDMVLGYLHKVDHNMILDGQKAAQSFVGEPHEQSKGWTRTPLWLELKFRSLADRRPNAETYESGGEGMAVLAEKAIVDVLMDHLQGHTVELKRIIEHLGRDEHASWARRISGAAIEPKCCLTLAMTMQKELS